VSGAALRLLQYNADSERLNDGSHVFSLMPDDGKNCSCPERAGDAHDMLDQSAPAGTMQHLG